MIESQATINTDDLIDYLAGMNERLVDLYSKGMCTEDADLRKTYQRSYERLYNKRQAMLIQLRDAINDEIGAE